MEPLPIQSAMQQLSTPQLTDSNQVAINQAIKKKTIDPTLSQQLAQGYNPSAISQAIASLSPNSDSPSAQIGKAIQTPAYAGLCLKWVDDQQGNTTRYPTAYADFQAHAKAGDIQTSDKIPSGARIYFSPNESNGNMGHVGIYEGNGKFISATDNGVKTFPIKDWENMTGQMYLGFTTSK